MFNKMFNKSLKKGVNFEVKHWKKGLGYDSWCVVSLSEF